MVLSLLSGVIGLAALAPWFSGMPWYLAVPSSLALAGLGLARLRHLRRTAPMVVEWASDDAWGVIDRHGEAFPAELVGFRVVGTGVLLRLRWENGQSPVFLSEDEVHPDDLRVLRVRLAGRSGAILP